jgi:hypothetical protein
MKFISIITKKYRVPQDAVLVEDPSLPGCDAVFTGRKLPCYMSNTASIFRTMQSKKRSRETKRDGVMSQIRILSSTPVNTSNTKSCF